MRKVGFFNRTLLIGSFASGLLTTLTAQAADILVDDFEAAISPAPWTFSNGAEFPGATGSLGLGQGHNAKGAHLAFNFSGGGNYVAANLNLPAPVTATSIGFWLKTSLEASVGLRVTDSTGQTLQFRLSTPLFSELVDSSGWYWVSRPLDAPSGFWGGANDGTLHQPVKSISILANKTIVSAKGNAIDFDDVTFIDNEIPLLSADSPSIVPILGDLGELPSKLGVNIHFMNDDKALDLAHSAGITWVRMDIGWGGVEKSKGSYSFTGPESLLSALNARGMKALFILDYNNPLYAASSMTGPATEENRIAFANYAAATAKQFAGRNVAYEVWNEPNIPGFWQPTPNAADYAQLCKSAVDAVHKTDSAAKISTGGLAGFDFPYIKEVMEKGGAGAADAIGVHPYRDNIPETIPSDFFQLRNLVKSTLSTSRPVWDTEGGFSSTWYGDGHSDLARHRQAVMAVRGMISRWMSNTPFFIYYDLRDDGLDPAEKEHNFGLLANDYSDKAAMSATRTLTKFTTSRKATGFFLTKDAGLHLLLLSGQTDKGGILWYEVANKEVFVPLKEPVQAQDMYGKALSLSQKGSNRGLIVREVDGPLYLSFPADPNPDAGVDASQDASQDASSDALSQDTSPDRSPGDSDSTADTGTTLPVSAESTDSGCSCRQGKGDPENYNLIYISAIVAAFALRIATKSRRQRQE